MKKSLALLAFVVLFAACTTESTPTSAPTSDIQATVDAAVAEALAAEPTTVIPTPTLASPLSTSGSTPVSPMISEVECGVEQLDATMFAASDVSQEEIDIVQEWVCISVRLYFDNNGTNWEMAGPIYIAQVERDGLDNAIALENVLCAHIRENIETKGYIKDRLCDPEKDPRDSGCDYGKCLLVGREGKVNGSSISSSRHKDGFYLFISRSHKMPEHHQGYKETTLHEMFHIFQLSNISKTDYSDVEFESLIGKLTGDDKTIHVPWWMEGTATYFAALYYSRQSGEGNNFIVRQGTRNLWSDYGTGRGNLLDQYLGSGRKLYNFEYGGADHQIGYRIGFWFVAYLVDQFGEDTIYQFYDDLEGNGFEKSFEMHFGKSYQEHVDDFDIFLTKPRTEILSILSN